MNLQPRTYEVEFTDDELAVLRIPRQETGRPARIIQVTWRLGRDGERWVIASEGDVLNADLSWEWEPQPSSRTDDFIARTRLASVAEAETRLRAYVDVCRTEGGAYVG